MTDNEIYEMVAKMTEWEVDALCYAIGVKGDRIETYWKLEDFEGELDPMPTPEQFADFAPWVARKASFNADWDGLWEWFCESNGIAKPDDDEEDEEEQEEDEDEHEYD